MILAFLFIGILAVWGIADYWQWKIGQQTMSQWIIIQKDKHPWFKWFVLIVLFAAASVLTWHWELLK